MEVGFTAIIVIAFNVKIKKTLKLSHKLTTKKIIFYLLFFINKIKKLKKMQLIKDFR